MSAPLAIITRVVSACVLLELEGGAVLTDPIFEEHGPTASASRLV